MLVCPAFGILCALLPLVSGQSLLGSSLRPLELVITLDSICSILPIRETQHHKGLSREIGSYVIERRKFHASPKSTTENIRIYAYDETVLWMQARDVCGVTMPGRDLSSQQKVLSPNNLRPNYSIEQLENISPPLQVELLVGSGPSANRVDLVFFADGCLCFLNLPPCFL